MCDESHEAVEGTIVEEDESHNLKSEELSDNENQDEGNCDVATNRLSKHALKKQRTRERWLEKRVHKRAEEKQRRKDKRAAMKEAGLGETLKRFKAKPMAESSCKVRVAVDMAFDHLMSEKDLRRCVQQLQWCYSANRRLPDPLQYHVVSFSGKSREFYDSIETNKKQDIHVHRENLDELFKPEEIVYLSAESDNVLSELDDSKVYVIGGLVDHNSQKGLCFELAKERGYGHARLPIDEFVEMKTRKVLTINHVFEILVHFTSTKNWETAFFKVIPQRKGAARKDDVAVGNAQDSEAVKSEICSECTTELADTAIAPDVTANSEEAKEDDSSPEAKRVKTEDSSETA